MIVFAAIAPHGAPALDDPEGETRRGFEELARRFDAAGPEATIVLTPHGLLVEGHFGVALSGRYEGDVSEWSDSGIELAVSGDPVLARECLDGLRADGLPAVGFTFGSSLADTATMPLDWGALIPLWFLGGDRVPAVVVTPSRDLPIREHVRAGAALARVAETSEQADRADRQRRPRPRSRPGRPVRLRAGVGRVRRARSSRSCARTGSATCSPSTRTGSGPRWPTAGGSSRCCTARSGTPGGASCSRTRRRPTSACSAPPTRGRKNRVRRESAHMAKKKPVQ